MSCRGGTLEMNWRSGRGDIFHPGVGILVLIQSSFVNFVCMTHIFYVAEDRDRRKGGHLLLEGSKREVEDRIVPRNVDADDADVDVKSDDSEDDDDDDEDDDEEALLAELELIRKEKAEQKLREEREKQEEELQAKEAELLRGNPLLNNPTSFSVKRRWDDDVVFKNQARGETKIAKRFINDTIRNDFHRKFLQKYMK
ncbi:CWC15 homolog [Olea europaea subsp. europaea]|uniref:CWC15 homolog n=1 Tax=Olea europaea subsp. europaea TaxID=158383 RepID=A0A8S0PID0_OLEEU|nr:CWC15 homolog [Olea europaea subsp. europaea]